MMPALKHFDMVLGVDTHIVLVPSPAGPIPTPIPHPYVGVLFDPLDYVPKTGATVYINGLPRATAGTAGMAVPPHIPMGGPFAKPPSNESEMFMGSSTVLADGEPLSYAGLPVLSCQDIGMPAPARAKKKNPAKSLMLPTSVAMPIPSGPAVLIGGAPTISMPGPEVLISPLAQALSKGAKLLARKSKLLKTSRRALSKHVHKAAGEVLDKLGISKSSALRNKVHRSICTVTGHPVDIATGKVFTEFVDLELGGPLPFKLERVWYSTSTHRGPFGHGWHASFDLGLIETPHWAGVRLSDGRVSVFRSLKVGESCYDPEERATLARDQYGYALTDAEGLTYRFSAMRGRMEQALRSIRDRNGFVVQFEYGGAQEMLRSIRDAGGRVWSFENDREGRITHILGPHPTVAEERVVYMTYGYDAWGNLHEARDALGACQRFAYEQHLLVRETNKNGLSFHFAYDGKDENAHCVRTWGDGGIYDHKLSYEPGLTVVQNSLGYETSYLHDGAMVNKTVDARGNSAQTEYGAGYRVAAETDALGQRTVFKYDERGNLIERTGPDGASLHFAYGPDDLPVRALDAIGGEWTWSYDARGRVTERKDPLGRVTRFHYHAQWLVGVTDPAGGYTALGYDARGNLDAVATPDNAVTRYRHDLLGRVVASVDPKGNTQRRELDLLGRTVRVHEPDGNLRELAYDPEGNVVHARDAQHDVRFAFTGMNRLAARSEAGSAVRFEYDTEEQLTGIVNEHGHAYRFKLGPTGQVDEEHGFDGLTRKYTRDEAGRVLRVDRPCGRFSAFEYEPAGRVIAVTHSDESTESYTYRLDGALLQASNDEATLVFERDALGRIIEESQGEHAVESEYDPLGRRTRMRSSLGAQVEITRDLMGDVTSLQEKSGFQAHFTRDQLGLELERSLPGGINSRWGRDRLGRPAQHTVRGEHGTLRAVAYQWEPNDRLRKVLDALEGPTEYRHDALGNLASARYPDGKGELRVPDAVGNLFRREDRNDRVYGPAGQLLAQSTARGEIHYAYDPEGNLLEKREPGGCIWRYEWNGAGMLAKVTRPDGSVVTFGYDPLGRRVRKTYRGQSTRWVWDGNVPLHEWVTGTLEPFPRDVATPPSAWSSTSAVAQRDAELEAQLAQGPPERGSEQAPITWLFEPESFAPLAKLAGGQQFSIATDHLGAPVLMADARGEAVWKTQYSVYGELRGLEGARHACPFRWPGQYEDLETGLYYNRYRYYDAEAGQYASQDPIGLAGGARPHAYVHDPITWADPLGLSGCKAAGGAKPPSLSPRGAGRRGAFREAKRQNGIPVSQQPKTGPNLDRVGRPQPGRAYEFEVPVEGGGKRTVTIRDDAAGHNYGPGDPQNRGPHFNDDFGNHYDY